jgi:hypothetical protein
VRGHALFQRLVYRIFGVGACVFVLRRFSKSLANGRRVFAALAGVRSVTTITESKTSLSLQWEIKLHRVAFTPVDRCEAKGNKQGISPNQPFAATQAPVQ